MTSHVVDCMLEAKWYAGLSDKAMLHDYVRHSRPELFAKPSSQ